MTQEELNKIVTQHWNWLRGLSGGIRADLSGADLRNAILSRADLRYTILRDANLSGAGLRYADLRDADLRNAILSDADLRYANLNGADLRGAALPHFLIVPQKGSFIGYKKTTKGVVRLLIPEDAKRINSLRGRKCRASKALVIDGDGVGGTGPIYNRFVYEEGATLEEPDFDGDIRVECTKGIHFFMTRKEAEEWN